MKLATVRDGSPDGALVVVSTDLRRAVKATSVADTLLAALESWDRSEPRLLDLAQALNDGPIAGEFEFAGANLGPPLPRAPQWLDGSAFHSHGDLMQKVFGLPPIEDKLEVPLMYQGASDDFLGPCDDMPLPSEAQGIDFEAELAVAPDRVPMGTPAATALRAHQAAHVDQRCKPADAGASRDEDGIRFRPGEARDELRPRGCDA